MLLISLTIYFCYIINNNNNNNVCYATAPATTNRVRTFPSSSSKLEQSTNQFGEDIDVEINEIPVSSHYRNVRSSRTFQSNSRTSSSNVDGWSRLHRMIESSNDRDSLQLLSTHHTANAILHLIELLADNTTSAHSTSSGSYTTSSVNPSSITSCIQTSMSDLNYPINPSIYSSFRRFADLAVRSSNLLTSLFMSATSRTSGSGNPTIGRWSFVDRAVFELKQRNTMNRFRDNIKISTINDTLTLDKSFFWAINQLNVQSDPRMISGSGIVFSDRTTFPIRISTSSSSASGSSNIFDNNGVGEYFAPYVAKVDDGADNNVLSFIDLSTWSSSSMGSGPTDSSGSGGSTDRNHHRIDWFRRHAMNRNLTTDIDVNHIRRVLKGSRTVSSSSRTIDESEDGDWVMIDDGFWTSPYLDCSTSGSKNSWRITYSVPFFAPTTPTGHKVTFKGVSVITIDLSKVDIDQCSNDPTTSLFSNTHKCHTETTDCLPIKGRGLRRGSYVCRCKPGYYIPLSMTSSSSSSRTVSEQQQQQQQQRRREQSNSISGNDDNFQTTTTSINQNSSINVIHHFDGHEIEEAFVNFLIGIDPSHDDSTSDPSSKRYPHDYQCIKCSRGCKSCIDSTPCFVEFDLTLRSIGSGLSSFCATMVILLLIFVFRIRRRNKSITMSRWIMLEMILLGAFLLYATIIIRFFEPSITTCIMEPWFREIGFGFFYGSVLIKLYRILAEFQTRKAHRICVRDKDLLKYLAAIIFVIVGYLSAWTAILLDSMKVNPTGGSKVIGGSKSLEPEVEDSIIVDESVVASSGLKFKRCHSWSWSYVTELGEICFLIVGVYMSYRIRNARIEIYREKWILCWIVWLELLISTTTYVINHVFSTTIHPDVIFLLFLLRTQSTITISLVLLFLPKFWNPSRPFSGSAKGGQRGRYFSTSEVESSRVPDAMKLHSAVLSNGELDIADISLSDMDPEEIRSELRRIYTQLQILRNKTMRKDNPHISKRRGGRKGTHRRFSLQPFSHKSSTSQASVTNPSNGSSHPHHHHHHSKESNPASSGETTGPTKSGHKESVRFSSRGPDYFDQTEISKTPEESTGSVEDPKELSASNPSSRKGSKPKNVLEPVSTER